eukprot:GDKI01005767.1.p1 GENE.GDKI01005767.1~~GDKI01005767.1.p1  ORF type:complete len:411 (-),score=123.10 GDKI01005767.1:250-1482(-)
MASNSAAGKLWQTGGGLHPLVEAYTVGEDYRLDGEYMLPFDVKASKAHAAMLQNINVITEEELKTLNHALDEILTLWEKGEFKVTREQEDGHTAIEQYVTDKYGEVGKKIHTGRSRNDQALTMIRLYMKERMEEAIKSVKQLAGAFRTKSHATEHIPMPGYTHMQKAMPTTVGRWFGSYADALADTVWVLEATLKQIDQNPLGSAAGFGISNLQLNRDMTTQLMGLARTQENPLYCGFSRGFFENSVLMALSQPVTILTRFAVDMMLFTMQETSYFKLPDAYVTGSSIMPQKKNYDLFEIMRANGRVFTSLQQQVQGIIMSLGSGYHRDFQVTKKAFVEGVELALQTVRLVEECVPNIEVNEERLKAQMTEELFVTDEVYRLVAEGKPFRVAYQEVKNAFFAGTLFPKKQ